MAHLEYRGEQLEIAEDWRVGELIEAENALGIDMMEAKGGAKMALVVFITIRRHDKQTPAGVLADSVMRMELSALADSDEGDAGPPAGAADVNGRASETAGQQTSGHQPSASLA